MLERFGLGISAACMLIVIGCQAEGQTRRSVEKGVEIVSNPRNIQNAELPTISRQLSISEQRPDLIRAGMRSMGEFDVNDSGDIFVIGYKNEKLYITKINAVGEYVSSFGLKGQGPGELEMPLRPCAIGDKLYITDRMKKLVIYGSQGALINEKRLPLGVDSAEPLSDGKFLLFGRDESATPGPDFVYYKLSLADPELREVCILDRCRWYFEDTRLMPFFMWRITHNRIIVINEDRGYEVWVFNFDGELVRRIRKAYVPQYADHFIKNAILGPRYINSPTKKSYIPSPLPCMRFFIADEKGRLFIMTYQRGGGPASFVYDVFDQKGELRGQMDFSFDWSGEYFGLKNYLIKNGNFYYYEKDENGYLTMRIDKIIWPGQH